MARTRLPEAKKGNTLPAMPDNPGWTDDRRIELGKVIRQAREAQHLTQQDLADAIGTVLRTIRRVERAEGGSTKIPEILEYLNIDRTGEPIKPRVPSLDEATLVELQREIDRRRSITPPPPSGPALSEVTFAELQAEIARRHGEAVRAATQAEERIRVINELPADLARRITEHPERETLGWLPDDHTDRQGDIGG